jgi:hypothetical protein
MKRQRRRFHLSNAELTARPRWQPAPPDTHFGWLRSKFYDGTPDNPVRKFGPLPIASHGGDDADQEAVAP